MMERGTCSEGEKLKRLGEMIARRNAARLEYLRAQNELNAVVLVHALRRDCKQADYDLDARVVPTERAMAHYERFMREKAERLKG